MHPTDNKQRALAILNALWSNYVSLSWELDSLERPLPDGVTL